MNNVTEKQIRVKGLEKKNIRKDDTHLLKDSLINFKENLESNLENKQKKSGLLLRTIRDASIFLIAYKNHIKAHR